MPSEKTDGPIIGISGNCYWCRHPKVVSSSCHASGPLGLDMHCVHPSCNDRYIGGSTYSTPNWCPMLDKALEGHLAPMGYRRTPEPEGK